MRPPDEAFAALNRLFLAAENRNEGAEQIASFLLAWANHKEYGGFNLASLARLDALVIKDIQVVTNALFDCGYFRLSDLGFGPRTKNISRVYQSEISAQRRKRNQRARANSLRRQQALAELLSYHSHDHDLGSSSHDTGQRIASMNMRQMRTELHRLTGISYLTTEDIEAFIRKVKNER
jgi:hypothetical protein